MPNSTNRTLRRRIRQWLASLKGLLSKKAPIEIPPSMEIGRDTRHLSGRYSRRNGVRQ